jgi:hypothetical protein
MLLSSLLVPQGFYPPGAQPFPLDPVRRGTPGKVPPVGDSRLTVEIYHIAPALLKAEAPGAPPPRGPTLAGGSPPATLAILRAGFLPGAWHREGRCAVSGEAPERGSILTKSRDRGSELRAGADRRGRKSRPEGGGSRRGGPRSEGHEARARGGEADPAGPVREGNAAGGDAAVLECRDLLGMEPRRPGRSRAGSPPGEPRTKPSSEAAEPDSRVCGISRRIRCGNPH